MKRYYVFPLGFACVICAFSIFSQPIVRKQEEAQSVKKNAVQRLTATEVLSAEQQDLKNIQEQLTQDAERNWTSYPAFDYKDVQSSIEILERLVGDAILNLESGIKVFARKTSRDMQVLLSLLDTYSHIAQKMDQEKLKQLRALL